jgi:Carboxylesterase family
MVGYWTEFAKNGDPNGHGQPHWPRFQRDRQLFLSLVPRNPATETNFETYHQCDFWDTLTGRRWSRRTCGQPLKATNLAAPHPVAPRRGAETSSAHEIAAVGLNTKYLEYFLLRPMNGHHQARTPVEKVPMSEVAILRWNAMSTLWRLVDGPL